jgi:DNA polymerase (family 10)
MDPVTIAAQLREIAVYYDLDGDRMRAIAYERAAKSVEAANGLPRLIDEGRLEELPGVGSSIAAAILELARRGSVAVLERLRAKWPAVIVELSQLPKVGTQRARKIHEAFAPRDLDAVAALCHANALQQLPGFGKLSEAKILQAIEDRKLHGARMLLVDAEDHATSLAAHLRGAAERVEIAGPVRRAIEIVDHLAYAVASRDPDAVVDRLASFPLVTSVDRAMRTGYLASGLRVELRVAPPASFGWAHILATGSPEHVALVRARAIDRGLDLDALEAADERRVYAAVGLPWLPPEVRDGTDETCGDDFTDLITLDDVTAAFHCHTTWSDGRNSVAEMALGAAERGFGLITITDHSAAATYASGLDADRLRAQAVEIRELVDPPVRVLQGTEADILADGTLDVPRELVGELGVVIASVHNRYKLDRDAMTARLVAAMRQPFFKVWGHALGRMVMRRDPIDVRLGDILDAVAESRAAIELNGDPHRLDLDPIHARDAARRGIKFVLSSDAHSVNGIGAVRYAVAMARRARLRKRDVLNTLPPDELAHTVAPR